MPDKSTLHTCSSAGHAAAVWIERARLGLGTLVRIGVEAADAADAEAALDRGFAALAGIHNLMSFHSPTSDVSRLNREAALAPLRVDRATVEVVRQGLQLAADSDGAFDFTVASHLVQCGRLPPPAGAAPPDPAATWRDVVIDDDDCIAYRRPLWIDLGGIAKGYAVDRAFEALQRLPAQRRRVDAGGDLRLAGPRAERVLLNVPGHNEATAPQLELVDASLASSASAVGAQAVHWDARRRRPVAGRRFASVVAGTCALADALTKVLLAEGPDADALLRRYGASGYLHVPGAGWQVVGMAT